MVELVRIDEDNIRKLYRKSINNKFLVSRLCLFLLQLVLFLSIISVLIMKISYLTY